MQVGCVTFIQTLHSKETTDIGVWEERLEPFRSDNAKLVKVRSRLTRGLHTQEVNELHMELVRRRDAAEAQLKKMKAGFRKVEHENSDLRFLNSQYAHKIRVLERESQVSTAHLCVAVVAQHRSLCCCCCCCCSHDYCPSCCR